MNSTTVIMLLASLLSDWAKTQQPAPALPAQPAARLTVFLDCATFECHEDYLREEIEFVEYVRDRSDADVHVLITRAETGSRGREYTLSFIGQRRFAGTDRALTVVSQASDSEDRIRRGLASTLTVGLLNYVVVAGVPEGLDISVRPSKEAAPAATAATDPWNRWIFSLNGNGEYQAEESTRERTWGVEIGADRITPEWKITIGSEFNQSREQFDLDEDEPFTSNRHTRQMNWLIVRGLDEHWSAGADGEIRSSTFDNTAMAYDAAPAIEWNYFPYSEYTRRQFRVKYAAGVRRAKYYEETLFGKFEETRAGQELSATYEQREPWGTLQGTLEFSNFFPGLDTHRLSLDTEVSLRIARGLSLNLEASASRIRDQLSLPRRDATPEEVLLRIRGLRTGFEVNAEFGITYQFGSVFASIVNPRFGQ